MKSEDIIKKDQIHEDDCDVCLLHDEASNKMDDKLTCPRCSKLIDGENLESDIRLVGEINVYTEGQNIENMVVCRCPECKEHIGFKPIPIMWNANHDIYMTGGMEYIPVGNIGVNEDIKKHIENYTERIRNGEDLQPWNLALWISRDIETIVATELYKRGLKY